MSENSNTNDDEQLTETAKTRWEWLSTLSAGAIILFMLAVMAALTLEPVPATWPSGAVGMVYLAAFLAALTYAIGEDTVAIVNKLRGNTGP
ncbi:MAG: hypothetical protein U5K70_04345 [Halodesulfurarchaeum sp.]|nr:hypothetical protein [Halodesulfurarchaeum sp.]